MTIIPCQFSCSYGSLVKVVRKIIVAQTQKRAFYFIVAQLILKGPGISSARVLVVGVAEEMTEWPNSTSAQH